MNKQLGGHLTVTVNTAKVHRYQKLSMVDADAKSAGWCYGNHSNFLKLHCDDRDA